MSRIIPKDAAAILVSIDSKDGFVDIELVFPEDAVDGDRRVAIVNLAEQLLESALFGEDYGEEL